MKILRNTYSDVIFLIFASILGSILVYYSCYQYGLGVTGDSVYYLSGADSLAERIGYIDFVGLDITLFPPFLSFLASTLINILNISAKSAFLVINSLSYGLSVLVYGLIFKEIFRDRKQLFYFGTIFILLSRSFFLISTNIASDPLFFAEQGIFLYFSLKYLKTDRILYLFCLAVMTNIMLLSRYLGVLNIGFGVLLIILKYAPHIKRIIINSLLFGLISSISTFSWVILRNYMQFNTLTGYWPGKVDILGNIKFSFARMANWIFPIILQEKVPLFILLMIVLGASLTFYWRYMRDQESGLELSDFDYFILITAIVYFLAITTQTHTTDHVHYYDDRYLLPLYFVFVFLFFRVLDMFVFSKNIKYINFFIYILFFLILLYNTEKIRSQIERTRGSGGEVYNMYNTELMRNLNTVQYISNLQDSEYKVYTNAPKLVYFYTGIRQDGYIFNSDIWKPDASDLLKYSFEHPLESPIIYAWFKYQSYPYTLFKLEQIIDIYEYEVINTTRSSKWDHSTLMVIYPIGWVTD